MFIWILLVLEGWKYYREAQNSSGPKNNSNMILYYRENELGLMSKAQKTWNRQIRPKPKIVPDANVSPMTKKCRQCVTNTSPMTKKCRQYVANDEKVSSMCRQYVANDEQVSPMCRQCVANDEKVSPMCRQWRKSVANVSPKPNKLEFTLSKSAIAPGQSPTY